MNDIIQCDTEIPSTREPIVVKIIGAPTACADGVKEVWRDVANWAGRQLETKYGDRVHTQYFDLFESDCPTLPPNSRLPVVFVNDRMVINGGKISIPRIRQEIDSLIVNVLD